ncbi:MAG: hypothetical protein WAS21_19910 [Geminicoccaceae bacterium]
MFQITAHELEQGLDGAVEVEPGLRRRGLDQSPNIANGIGYSAAVPDHALDGLSRLREIGQIPAQPAQGSLSIDQHGRERLVHLVDDVQRALAIKRRLGATHDARASK